MPTWIQVHTLQMSRAVLSVSSSEKRRVHWSTPEECLTALMMMRASARRSAAQTRRPLMRRL